MIVIDGKRYLSTVETAVKMTRRSSWMIPIDEIEKRVAKSTESDCYED